MGNLRLAVVGVGRMGLTHAENLARRVRGAQLVAVTTSDPDRAREAQRRCAGVAVYTDLASLLAAEELDAVCIASSTSAHAANVILCAGAGLDIFCEKPLALSVEDCDRALSAVHQAGIKMMMGHVRQFDAGHVEAKRLIDQGAIGKPLVFRAISGDVDPPPPAFADPAVSGGLILDAMYHDLYLARWLVGDEVVRTYAEGGALVAAELGEVGDVDNAVVTLRFKSGALGTLYVSRTTRYGHDLRIEVIGEEGAVHIGRLRQTPVRLLDRRGVCHDTPMTTPERLGEAFVTEMQAFVDCVVQDREPAITGEESRAIVAIGLAATRSLHQRQPVNL